MSKARIRDSGTPLPARRATRRSPSARSLGPSSGLLDLQRRAGNRAVASLIAPRLQRMSFARRNWKTAGVWGAHAAYEYMYAQSENDLLAAEARVGEVVRRLAGLATAQRENVGQAVTQYTDAFEQIAAGDYEPREYGTVMDNLGRVEHAANRLVEQFVGEGSLGNIWQAINDAFGQLPAEMQTAGNMKKLTLALYPAAERREGWEERFVSKADTVMLEKRAAPVVAALTEVHRNLLTDWNTVKVTFGLPADATISEIALTGSDFHEGGKQVCIVTPTTGPKVVYKPRSVKPDADLAARMQKLGEAIPELATPTLTYLDMGDRGYAEHAEQLRVMPDADAPRYYTQLGRLTAFSKLLGIADLHPENIMATPRGPVIIDAEVSFQPYVMAAMRMRKDNLETLKEYRVAGKLAENAFLTRGELGAWEGDGRLADLWKTKEQYTAAVRRNSLAPGGAYVDPFLDGINDVLKTVKEYPMELAWEAVDATLKTAAVRIVPVATADFTKLITRWVEGDAGGQLSETGEKVIAELRMMGFTVRADPFWEQLKADVEKTDTPKYVWDPTSNELRQNGNVVGDYTGDAILRIVEGNVERLFALSAAELADELVAAGKLPNAPVTDPSHL